MKKSFRKRKYSNRKYSKKRYKTNKKRGNTKKKRKYTKRGNKKKTLRLTGGSGRQGEQGEFDQFKIQAETEAAHLSMVEKVYNEMLEYKFEGENYNTYMREKQSKDFESERDNSEFRRIWDSITDKSEKRHIYTNESNNIDIEKLRQFVDEFRELKEYKKSALFRRVDNIIKSGQIIGVDKIVEEVLRGESPIEGVEDLKGDLENYIKSKFWANVTDSIPIYKNKSVANSKTNLVFVLDPKDGIPKIYFKKEGKDKIAGSSPQNGSLEGWTVKLIEQEDVGVRGGITGVENPHGLITLTAPVGQRRARGNFYVGFDGGSYINPIKILPRVGEDGVGSRGETFGLYKKLEEIIMQKFVQRGQQGQQEESVAQPIQSPNIKNNKTTRVQKEQSSSTHGHEGLIEDSILDLYIKAVEHVISKFKAIDGLNTGGVFRVKSDDLSKHSDSFDKYLSDLNSVNLPNFMKYVNELPQDPLLLANLLAKMYRKMPFDIISKKELDILTHEDTVKFYESLGGGDSKRSILLNLLLTLFKEIDNSSYSGGDKMTAKASAALLPSLLKIDGLLGELIQGAMIKGDFRIVIKEINDKMETLILYS